MQGNSDKNITSLTTVESYINKAFEYLNNDDVQNAMQYAKLAFDIAPQDERCLNLMGIVYKLKNDPIKSIHYLKMAISANKQNPNNYYNLGIILRETGDLTGAIDSQESALALSNNNPLYLNEIGLIYIKQGNLKQAREILQSAYQIDPTNVSACINLSHLYVLMNDIRNSIEFSNKAIELDSERPESYNNLGKALISANFHEQGVAYIKQAYFKGIAKPAHIHQSILMNMLYPDCFTPEEIFAEHKEWATTHLNQTISDNTYSHINRDSSKKLNIGFISPDFKNHSVSYFLIPLLENINHNKFHTYCYSITNIMDEVTEYYKTIVDEWRNIANESDTAIIEILKQDKIDILIELSGHSLGSRIEILNKKVAPIQISYLGYPFSTGLSNIDYRISDNFADPEQTTDHLHTEKLLRLEPSFLCYKPGNAIPIDETIPAEKNSYLTFGSFNKLSKLSKSTIQLWSEVLLAVENSRILLKNSEPIPELLKDNLLSTFEKFGVHHSRIILHNPIDNNKEHMAYYNNVDICLDTIPYNGTTTTFEAIFMGVPVITLVGKSHYSRVGYSILSNLNLMQFIADSTSSYVDIAKNIANDIPSLKAYHHSLREILMSSSLTDAKQFALKFESLIQQTWKEFCKTG